LFALSTRCRASQAPGRNEFSCTEPPAASLRRGTRSAVCANAARHRTVGK
jgi:hypothetical protein